MKGVGVEEEEGGGMGGGKGEGWEEGRGRDGRREWGGVGGGKDERELMWCPMQCGGTAGHVQQGLGED